MKVHFVEKTFLQFVLFPVFSGGSEHFVHDAPAVKA